MSTKTKIPYTDYTESVPLQNGKRLHWAKEFRARLGEVEFFKRLREKVQEIAER